MPDFTQLLMKTGLSELIAAIILFVIGLVLLIKCGDWFVDGASGIAKKFHVPEILIGATVVSIGTTLPEVMVSATSAASGHGTMAYGNAIGSIICNTALIAAITIAVKPSKVARKSFLTPVIFFFVAAGIFSANAYLTGKFSRTIGGVLLAIFVIYMAVLIRQALVEMKHPEAAAEVPAEPEEKEKELAIATCLIFLVIGAAGIAVGADLLVDNGTIIAQHMGVPESVIALTFIALGTSLPELVTAITSLAKGHGALSLGNIVGANLFNLVLVCSVSSIINPFSIPAEKTIAGINSSLVIDVPVMLFVMAFMTIPALVRQKLSRVQGIVLLCVYAAFTVIQFIL